MVTFAQKNQDYILNSNPRPILLRHEMKMTKHTKCTKKRS
jgi:hypothetical protein